MFKGNKILGVITARGGSKGIPKKNIKNLGGKPLIAWTIEAARGSKLLDRLIVSTDSEEIAEVARASGADVPFMRPAELAADKSKSVPVIQHALKWMKENKGEEFGAVMILQPTSPFRTSEDIDESIKLLFETGADSVMSMVELTDFSLPKLKVLDGNKILPLIQEEGRESASRDAGKPIYKRNCAIYLTKTEFIEKGDLFGSDSRAYIMPAERSVDINAPADFVFAEFLASKKQ